MQLSLRLMSRFFLYIYQNIVVVTNNYVLIDDIRLDILCIYFLADWAAWHLAT